MIDVWDYTIKIGTGEVLGISRSVWQIVDPDGEVLAEGDADDYGDAITRAAAAILSVEDSAA